MLLELSPGQLLLICASDDALKEKVNEALTILREADGSATARVSQQPGSGAQNPSDKSNTEGQPLVGGTSASAFTTVTR